MKSPVAHNKWKVLSRFTTITTPWVTVIGERLLDDSGTELEYWRVEKASGALIVTIQNNELILPCRMYRPGMGARTLDFCGGRSNGETPMHEVARDTIIREFKIIHPRPQIDVLPLNTDGWNVDSSFSNVKMYGYVATIAPDVLIAPENIGARYPMDEKGYKKLLSDLECMQCRMLFHEWRLTIKDKV